MYISHNKAKAIQSTDTGPVSRIVEKDGYKIWGYFGDNLYPDRLIKCKNNSPTNQSILELKAGLTKGKKLVAKAADPALQPLLDAFVSQMCDGYGLHELLYRVASDWFTFGGYALQVWGFESQPNGFDHVPFGFVRKGHFSSKDEEGGKYWTPGYIVRKDWTAKEEKDAFGKPVKPLFFLPYEFGAQLSIAPRLLYRIRYSDDKTHYPLPEWVAAVKSCETEIELINYKHASVLNGFMASGIVNIPGVDQEALDRYQASFDQLRGSDAAGSLLFVSTNSAAEKIEIQPLTFSPAEKDVANYQQAAKAEIIAAHGLSSGTLIGEKGGASLGGDGGTMDSALNQLMETKIKPARNMILGDITRLLALAGFEGVTYETEDVEYMDETKIDTSEVLDETLNTLDDGTLA
jgi:hypothetical protein